MNQPTTTAEHLQSKKCTACSSNTPPLTEKQATELSSQLAADWQLVETGKALAREFRFKDFYQTIAFVNAVAWIANTEDHHPDLEVGYNRCLIRYSTHAIGGLSENDFICAAKIDALID